MKTFLLLVCATQLAAQPYYVLDSDHPSALHPRFAFVDTLYQPASWHRILPGPKAAPTFDSTAVRWRSNNGDSTNNTFAGPIPIGFHFNYYGVDRDSVYLSSNGFIGFGDWKNAAGIDSRGYSAFTTKALPDTSASRAIAAFMMTDGEMVRTKFDSSRAFYRTSPSNDSFFITLYRYYHISGTSTANTIHKFAVDVQIVLTARDSAITFNYRNFTGAVQIGLINYSATTAFRNGCIPSACTNLSAVIGVQDGSRTQGATYMSTGAFTSPGTAELHGGLAVAFRPLHNVCSVDSILEPRSNFEMMVGDSISPVAVVHNRGTATGSFDVTFQMRNVRDRYVVYQWTDSNITIAAGKTGRANFPQWKSDPSNDHHVGALIAVATVVQSVAGHEVADGWPLDDTLRHEMHVIKRLDNFTDFNNNFTTPGSFPVAIPNVLQWVSTGATVVDGDANTFLPPPPRGNQGDPAKSTISSPVIKLDRLDVNGNQYSPCAFGGVGYNVSGLRDGGVGDTITSFPINIAGAPGVMLGFDVERAGKHDYPRWYDLAVVTGPERTVVNADTNSRSRYRTGDSLVIEFADSAEITNVTKWHRKWAMDGGKDFRFKRIFVSIDSSFLSDHFRFRARLKAKNDFEPGNPDDDEDAWYLDNIVVLSPVRPELEITAVRVPPSWPYTHIPAKQAVAVPIEVVVANNGGLMSNPTDLVVTIRNVLPSPPVYTARITFTMMGIRDTVIAAPPWNAGLAGSGQYIISATFSPHGYDSESQNDSTFSFVTMQFDSVFAYDDGMNDVPGFYQLAGLGIRLEELDPGNSLGGMGQAGDTGSGTIAVKFDLAQRDTLDGVQVWFGSFNNAPDWIRISVYKSLGSTPGDTVKTGCPDFDAVRTPPFDEFGSYVFPCGPIVLDSGEYWIGVSQLGESGLALGASAFRSSCDWLAYDPSLNENHLFTVNYPQVVDRFAYENTARSNAWYPFYFPAGIGKAAYSYPKGNSAYGKRSIDCDTMYNFFHAQGSWIPLVRPYFSTTGRMKIEPQTLNFGYLFSCDGGASRLDTAQITNRNAQSVQLSIFVTGDTAHFFLVSDSSVTIAPGGTALCVVEAKELGTAYVPATATLNIVPQNGIGGPSRSVALTSTGDVAGIRSTSTVYSFGTVSAGSTVCKNIMLYRAGTASVPDSITGVSFTNADSGFALRLPFHSFVANAPDTVTVCFTSSNGSPARATLNFFTEPCQKVFSVTLLANGATSIGQEAATAVPGVPTLEQNRPNPFSDESTIGFETSVSGRCRVTLVDMLGRECAVICDEILPAGHFSRTLHARDLPAGNYVCTLTTSSGMARRMTQVAR